jgi:hypothetical protein
MADEDRSTRLEHRIDLVLERMEQNEKRATACHEALNHRLDDLTTAMNIRFDDVNRRFDDINGRFADMHHRFDDLSGRFIRLEALAEARLANVEASLKETVSTRTINVWKSVALVWLTIIVGVATAIITPSL